MTPSVVFPQRALALSVAIALMASSPDAAQASPQTAATAQQPATGVPDFARGLEGQKIWVTNTEGFRKKGLVTSLSTAGLVLDSDGSTATVPFNQISKVEKSTRRVRKHALVGLLVGSGLGAGVGIALCAEDDCGGWEPLVFVGIYGGIGTAIGAGVGAILNAARKDSDVLYIKPPRTTTMSLMPILSPTRKGMAFAMTWR